MAIARASRMFSGDNSVAITSLGITHDVSDYMSFDDPLIHHRPSGLITIDLQMRTTSHEFVKQLHDRMHDGLSTLAIHGQEYMCAFCHSPNPLTHRHCSQCGAPRGFILT